MPRRNSKPIKHVPFQMTNNDRAKVRYVSKNAAEKAAEERMLLDMSLELTVYQGLDGGWYLTRNTHKSQ
jgi:hypothetical protein